MSVRGDSRAAPPLEHADGRKRSTRRAAAAGQAARIVSRRRAGLLALVVTLALVGAGGASVWQLLRSPVPGLIVPGAVAVHTQSHGLGGQQITYQSHGRPYGWYFVLVRNLAASGWTMPLERREGIHDDPEVYWRLSPLWFGYLKEEVAVEGDPDFARITIRREIILPWRRYLP